VAGNSFAVLLDTHVILWALTDPAKLSKRVRLLLEDPKTQVVTSTASAWEIATKWRLGKLPEATAIVKGYRSHLTTMMATELAITSEHALTAGCFDAPHRDPFDRILAAQAVVEDLMLVTSDSAFRQFDVRTVWK
jgi:PIN domain nuclease of toxin-antitoxin system